MNALTDEQLDEVGKYLAIELNGRRFLLVVCSPTEDSTGHIDFDATTNTGREVLIAIRDFINREILPNAKPLHP